jgi:hypothetical protein
LATDYLAEKYPGGTVLAESIDRDEDLRKAVADVLRNEISKDTLREFSKDYFDLEKGCNRYLENYRRLITDQNRRLSQKWVL